VPAVAFPPAAFPAPYERVARPGDGVWTPLAELVPPTGDPFFVRSVVHPHPVQRFIAVELAAFDLRRVEVRLVAGTAEPESGAVAPGRRTGLVPASDLQRLIAVFNNGFQARHGHYGMRVGDDVFLPPIDDACTFGLRRDGRAIVGEWSSKVRAVEDDLIAWRQTPPCLVADGVTHPLLDAPGPVRRWGVSIEGKLEIRRSAVGVDASGTILYFGIGEEVTPKDLAVAMKAAGAVDAAELDINWSYTRFLVYGAVRDAEVPDVMLTLLPKMKYACGEYVSRPATRDFFYVRLVDRAE